MVDVTVPLSLIGSARSWNFWMNAASAIDAKGMKGAVIFDEMPNIGSLPGLVL